MRILLSALPVLGCVAMTIGCARMMSRRACSTPAPDEVRLLKEEVEGLRARLDDPARSSRGSDGAA